MSTTSADIDCEDTNKTKLRGACRVMQIYKETRELESDDDEVWRLLFTAAINAEFRRNLL